MTRKQKPILSIDKAKSSKPKDPVERFLASIKSKSTCDGYKKTFTQFLRSVKEFDGTFEDMAKQFYSVEK